MAHIRLAHVFLTYFALVFLVGCSRESGGPADGRRFSYATECPPEWAAQPADEATPEDFEVIAVVLKDLKEASELVWNKDKSQIIVHEQTEGLIPSRPDQAAPRAFWLSNQLESDLRSRKRSVSNELREALRRRNSEKVPLAGFESTDRDILVADLTAVLKNSWPDTFSQAYPDAKAWVRMWLPGYSKDGRMAIVRFFVGPTRMGQREPIS
jgi:hypothetical protein